MLVYIPITNGQITLAEDIRVQKFCAYVSEGSVTGFGTDTAGTNLFGMTNPSALGPLPVFIDGLNIPLKAGTVLNAAAANCGVWAEVG